MVGHDRHIIAAAQDRGAQKDVKRLLVPCVGFVAEQAAKDRQSAEAGHFGSRHGAVIADQAAQNDGPAVVGQDRRGDGAAVGDQIGRPGDRGVGQRGDLLAHVQLDHIALIDAGHHFHRDADVLAFDGGERVVAGAIGAETAGPERDVLANDDFGGLIVQRGDRRGGEQVGLGRLPQGLQQDAVAVLPRKTQRQPAGGQRRGLADAEQCQDVVQRRAGVGEGCGGKPARRRGFAKAQLDAQFLGDVARNLDNRGLDQDLRATLIKVLDQACNVVLHRLAGAHDDGVGLNHRFDGHTVGGGGGCRCGVGLRLRGCGLRCGGGGVGIGRARRRGLGGGRQSQGLRHRVGDLAATAPHQSAQHVGQRGRIGKAQPVDMGDQHGGVLRATLHIQIGDDAQHQIVSFDVRAQDQHIGIGIDRDARRIGALRRAEDGLDGGTNFGRIGVAERDRIDLLRAAGVERAGDGFDLGHVVGGVGDDQGVGVGHCLNIAKARHQGAEGFGGGGRRKGVEFDQPGDHIQPARRLTLWHKATAFLDILLLDDPPEIAGGQGGQTIDRQDRLKQLPDLSGVHRRAGQDRDLAGHAGIEHDGAPGDARNLLCHGFDIGVAQVQNEGAGRWGRLISGGGLVLGGLRKAGTERAGADNQSLTDQKGCKRSGQKAGTGH